MNRPDYRPALRADIVGFLIVMTVALLAFGVVGLVARLARSREPASYQLRCGDTTWTIEGDTRFECPRSQQIRHDRSVGGSTLTGTGSSGYPLDTRF